MPAEVDIGSLIWRKPGLHNNRPCIAGTGITVRCFAVWNNCGWTPEEIAVEYPHITLAQVHGALAYYYSNKEEIDRDIAENDAAEEEFKRQMQPEMHR